MTGWMVFLSLLALLAGTFALRNIRIGAAAALLITLAGSVYSGSLSVLWSVDFLNGFIIAAELTLLLAGALLFYRILDAHAHFGFIDELISAIPSRLSLVLILCLFLGSFFEGVAGFGVPAMLIAPLLVKAGFRPFSAIILALAGNSTAVTFGALGTPLKFGFGIIGPEQSVTLVLMLNSLPAAGMPFVLAWLYFKTEQKTTAWKQEWKGLLGAGISYIVPYILTGLVTVEFPSVVAGLVGLLIYIFLVVKPAVILPFHFWVRAFYPYILFIGLLLIGRNLLGGLFFAPGDGLRVISWYQPGLGFMTASVVYLMIMRVREGSIRLMQPLHQTVAQLTTPVLTITLLVLFTQMVRSDMATILIILMGYVPDLLQLMLIPVAGVAGSFVTGSATMSNLLLAELTQAFSHISASATVLAIALLNTGSALGNTISLQNIVMVKSVVRSDVSEALVVKLNSFVVLVYILLVWIVFSGIVGLAL
jgi:lactate permease